MHFLPFLLLLVFSCSHQPENPDESAARGQAQTRADKSSCEKFDMFVQGKLSDEEEQAFRESCRKNPQESIFCRSLERESALEKRIARKTKVPKFVPPKPIAAYPIKIADNKVVNWKRVRAANVKALLKGMQDLPPEQLHVIKKVAIKEKRCPNNAAVVVAATLEDYLPDRAQSNEIAGLYEKAADCARNQPVDREHYLTRAGLLHYQRKEFKIASLYFNKALKIEASSRAMYWLYRSYEGMGDAEAAKKALDSLISRFPLAFHTLVAATSNQRDPGDGVLKPRPASATQARSQKVPGINPLIEQAEALKLCGMESSAGIIADWALDEAGKAEPEVRFYIAELAGAASRITIGGDLINRNPPQLNRLSLELFFPKAFYPIFEKHSGSLDPFILMSLARQESTFNEKAISPANAQGLMQIHPDTSIKLTSGKQVDLLDPEVSVQLGARYLAELLKRHSRVHLALAAYNAGEEKLGSWLIRYPTNDPLLFTDLISYRETRNYVSIVLRNYYWYRRIHGGGSDALAKVIDPEVARK